MPPKIVGQKRAQPDDSTAHIEGACVLKQLECTICMETILPPIWHCDQSHLLCSGCRDKLPTPRKCPTCRITLRSGQNHFAERLAANLIVPCRHAPRGCTVMSKYSVATDHGAACDYRDVACIECGWKGCHTAMFAHYEECHPDYVAQEWGPLFSIRLRSNLRRTTC